MQELKTKAYGASGALIGGKTLKPIDIVRKAPENDEVLIDILYCGVCHSDMHQVNNDWKNTIYPCIPGHELVGKVVQTGPNATKYKTGDTVGVGCMIDSCNQCYACEEGNEQYCEGPVGFTATYNGYMNPKDKEFNTYGGYSTQVTVKEKFVLRIPDKIDIKAAGPILCAGVTTYSPLKHWKVKKGDKVGVIGLGGLGHMAVMLAKAMGADVTVITTSESKRNDALALGAHNIILSEDKEMMKQNELTFDFMLCTIPDEFDINPYVCLLKRDGTLVTVGLIGPYKNPTNNQEIIMHRRNVSGSLIGSLEELSDAESRANFDTNVFGSLNVETVICER
ncbi:MAG: NAD(P)-dependent alcohol dehydrogenase, partial [Sphingobacteriales bacterium]